VKVTNIYITKQNCIEGLMLPALRNLFVWGTHIYPNFLLMANRLHGRILRTQSSVIFTCFSCENLCK